VSKWARFVVGLAAIRVGLAMVVYLSAPQVQQIDAQLPPSWVYAVLCAALTLLGLGLLLTNRHDERAAWLGGLFVLIGAPLASQLIQGRVSGTVLFLFSYIRLDPFIGVFLWRFLERFPSELAPVLARRARVFSAILAGVALWSAVAFFLTGWPGLQSLPGWSRGMVSATRGSLWLVTLSVSAAALLVLLWRANMAQSEDRWRVRLFATGLLVGLAPITLEILVEESWPAYQRFIYRPSVRPWVGVVIFGALATVPWVTAYSVLFDRVVEVRVVLRTAVQHALARYTILAATLVPFAALAIFFIDHRQESLVALFMDGPRPAILTACVGLGIATLRMRTRWLDAVDRRYFREAYDVRQMLTRVMTGLGSGGPLELGPKLADEIDRALHADAEVFLADVGRGALCDVRERLPPIALTATLISLVVADSRPMDVDLASPSSPLRRLPEHEQRWLARGGFSLLVGFRGADGGAAGLLALTPKKSGLAYSADDRHLLSAIASAAAIVLDNLRLRRASDSGGEPAAARECPKCSRLWPSDAELCTCGSELTLASVPYILRGVFRFEQRIGAGAMGVVYRAVDLNLGRQVAIKALPRITPEHIARVRREARAMAVVTHPNLAVIHGVETWQDVPFLVEEYVSGGTLARRLASSRPEIGDVLEWGVTLSDFLVYLHAHGIVHCDIKPSNIGFTDDGILKVLDFGLARLLRDVALSSHESTITHAGVGTGSTDAGLNAGPFGTPHFMSPEAIIGDRPRPSRDLWALAVLLFDAISGRPPFEGADMMALHTRGSSDNPFPDIRTLRPDVPAAMAAFFEAALARDLTVRLADTPAFAAAVRRLREQCR
jgi:hypothetical protein